MIRIALNDGCDLSIAAYNGKARLMVLQNNEEVACRIEKINTLRDELSRCSGCIFEGRLQLYPNDERVEVRVKEEVIGEVWKEDLLRGLSHIAHLGRF